MILILTVRKPVGYCTAGGTTSRVDGKQWGKAACSAPAPPCVYVSCFSTTLCFWEWSLFTG